MSDRNTPSAATTPRRARRPLLVATAVAAATLCVLPAGAAFAASAPAAPAASTSAFGAAAETAALTPSETLASTPWETTSAVDQNGNPVALDDANVANFVGWAYYNIDGTFTMYNLDDSPKMQGDWEVAADGSTRTITARDADGNTLFTRVVPITELTDTEFTYRVIPDAANPGVYYDIVHTPTDHAEPGTINYSEVLASTPWETTSAVDQNGNPVALDDANVANFVGWAYYNIDGTFTMYNLDDSPKMQGDWEVAADGSTRTITARDADGNPLFTRVVPITELTDTEFTYRVIPDAANPGVYYDIVHTPTDHAEPGTINYSEVLASTPWETTSAVDQNGNPVALDDANVANFVGWAYYNIDGTFTMYNLDDSPKMQGDWEVAADGSTRTITARDADGNPLFTRVVPITELTDTEFTYRVIPDAANPGVYYDIVHTPTNHPEPTPGTEDPGTEDPGTENPGTTDPGTENPGTSNPGTSNPGTTDPASTDQPAAGNTAAAGAKAPGALAITGANAPVVAGIAAALAVLGGLAAFVVRMVRRAG